MAEDNAGIYGSVPTGEFAATMEKTFNYITLPGMDDLCFPFSIL